MAKIGSRPSTVKEADPARTDRSRTRSALDARLQRQRCPDGDVRRSWRNGMNLARPAATLMAATALLLCSPTHASAEDGKAQREKVVKCVNAEMEKENTARKGKEAHLTDAQLKALQRIVDAEVMTGPLKPSVDEQKRLLKRIEDAAKKDRDLKDLPTATIDKIVVELQEKGAYCVNEK
ncbi:hypothetical protein [Kitasatospora sp. NPDC005856]|uniref:hypothetical protein n=1 Tax=Kitasatospora sp. NPDC005856 TaxID=3154566 RepID=UPI0033CDBD28